MADVIGKFISSFFGVILGILQCLFGAAAFFTIGVLAFFFIRYRLNPLRLTADKLRQPYIPYKYLDLFRWLLVDFLERGKHRGEFKEYGFTFFVGRQGAGKTISMVRYLEVMKEHYPDCLIVTNFQYYRSNYIMVDWRDLLSIRNGEKGVIFAIDEIHSEYDLSLIHISEPTRL